MLYELTYVISDICPMVMSLSVEDWYVFEIYSVKSKIWYRTILDLCLWACLLKT